MFGRTGAALVLAAWAATAVRGLQLEQDAMPGFADADADAEEGDVLAADGVALDVTFGLGKDVTVVVNGEPKSGTTWLEHVLRALVTEYCGHAVGCDTVPGDHTVAAKTAADLVTFSVEGKHVIPYVGHKNDFDFSRAPKVSDADLRAAASRRLEEASSGTRWLAIFRDPRDVTISACYHMYKGCPNADKYMSKRLGTITAWIDLRYRLFKAMQGLAPERVTLLFYEEMRRDEQGTIMDLAELFGVPLDREQAARISAETTFDAMALLPKTAVAQDFAASGKVREGLVCGYKKVLSEAMVHSSSREMRRILNSELSGRWTC